MNTVLIRTIVALGGLASATTLPASAIDAPAGLGEGIHAFHGGHYAESFDWLSVVIEAGSKDPRAFYFRGLSALRCGREIEAEADFLEGARLEAMGSGGLNIGRSLERVQGADRLLIERYRAKARAAVAVNGRESDRRRSITAPPEPDESVFRRRRPEFEGDARGKAAAADRAASPAPLPAGDAEAAEPPMKAEAEEPAAEAPSPAKADPFGDDPFGAGEGEPAERKAAEAEAAADGAAEQAERGAAGRAANAVDDFN